MIAVSVHRGSGILFSPPAFSDTSPASCPRAPDLPAEGNKYTTFPALLGEEESHYELPPVSRGFRLPGGFWRKTERRGGEGRGETGGRKGSTR